MNIFFGIARFIGILVVVWAFGQRYKSHKEQKTLNMLLDHFPELKNEDIDQSFHKMNRALIQITFLGAIMIVASIIWRLL